MANPQPENGYATPAVELMDALAKTRMTGREARIMLYVIRWTYGVGMTDHEGTYIRDPQTGFPLKQKMTWVTKRHISKHTRINGSDCLRVLARLVKRKMLVRKTSKRTKVGGDTTTNRKVWYGVQKNYDNWKLVATSPLGGVFAQKVGGDVTPLQKNKNTKDITSQSKLGSFDENVLSLSELLRERILQNKPDISNPDVRNESWFVSTATAIDRMIQLDGRDPDRIREVIEWSQDDPFWKSNILSGKKLRDQFDQLEMKMQSPSTPVVANW